MQRTMSGRALLVLVGCMLLAFIYIFQQTALLPYIGLGHIQNEWLIFSLTRAIRVILNDAACILIIHAVFNNKRNSLMAGYFFCFEFFVLLPIYLAVKLVFEGPTEISSPLLSQFHRLIVNPVLMFVLFIGMYFQRKLARSENQNSTLL
jgi:hypothetical protein